MPSRTRAHRISAGIAVATAGALLAPAAPSTASPPSTVSPPSSDPAGSSPTTATTMPPVSYENGILTAPDGSFTAAFAGAPSRTDDPQNGVVTYLARADEDTESVALFPPAALGATPASPPGERADAFLDASGTDIMDLANTPTNLGPYPASHFAARITLGDGRRATVYGLVVDRGVDVVYAFYTDIGDDDNAAGTAFVQSFAVVMDRPPSPFPPSPTSTSPTAPTSSAPATTSVVATMAEVDPTEPIDPPTTTTTTIPPPATVTTAPDGALLGYDGRWWIAYPAGAEPAFRASTDNGFAYAEYLAVDGDDTLIVTVTEVPPGYAWDAEQVPATAAERLGGAVVESTSVEVEGRPAVRLTLSQDDGATSGDTVEMLVVNGGDQIYSIRYEDGGATSTALANQFIDSFGLA